MKCIKAIALLLVIIGAINWLLVGLFHFNLVTFLFGWGGILVNIIYIVVGISGIICISMLKSHCPKSSGADCHKHDDYHSHHHNDQNQS